MKHVRRDVDRDATIRRALERAVDGEAPGVDRIVARVPAILAEASRRRIAAAAPGLLGSLVPLARRAVPRLAAATGVIVLLATATALNRAPAEGGSATSVESVVLDLSTDEGREDPLLQAIVGVESGHE